MEKHHANMFDAVALAIICRLRITGETKSLTLLIIAELTSEAGKLPALWAAETIRLVSYIIRKVMPCCGAFPANCGDLGLDPDCPSCRVSEDSPKT